MMNAVGIDVSKRKSTVTILRPGDEVVLDPIDIPHTQFSLEDLIALVRGLDGDTKIEVPTKQSTKGVISMDNNILQTATRDKDRSRNSLEPPVKR